MLDENALGTKGRGSRDDWDLGVAVLNVAVGLVPRRESEVAAAGRRTFTSAGVKPTASIGEALRAMLLANSTSVALLDDHGAVLAAVEARDIAGWLRSALTTPPPRPFGGNC